MSKSPLRRLNEAFNEYLETLNLRVWNMIGNVRLSDLTEIEEDILEKPQVGFFDYGSEYDQKVNLLARFYEYIAENYDVQLMQFMDLCFPTVFPYLIKTLYDTLPENAISAEERIPEYHFWCTCTRSEDFIMSRKIGFDMFEYLHSKLSPDDIENFHLVFAIGRQYEFKGDIENSNHHSIMIYKIITEYPHFLRQDEVNFCLKGMINCLDSDDIDIEGLQLAEGWRDDVKQMINFLYPYSRGITFNERIF